MIEQRAYHLAPGRADRDGPLPASLSQARLWFADQVGRRGLEFIYPYALRLRGELDVAALAAALDAVVARHETLRTTFTTVDGQPFQVIHPPFSMGLAVTPVHAGDASPEDVLMRAIGAVVDIPFNLNTGPVVRARLFRLAADDHVFLVVLHHIATDGWSMEIFLRDLQELYRARREGREPDLPVATIQFADVAVWQRARHAAGDYAEDLAFWRRHLDGCPHVLDLPLDHPRPASQRFEGGAVDFAVPAETARRVEELARAAGASTYMVLLVAFQALLARWSGQHDFIVGVPAANRELSETENLIGFFMNLLPVRARVDPHGTFRELLAKTREQTLEAYDHQSPSFDLLVEEVAPERTLAHNPLVQVTFNLEPEVRVDLPGIQCEVVPVEPDVTRYDLAFDYHPAPSGELRFRAYYSSDLFDHGTVAALTRRYAHTLDRVTERPDRPLLAIPQMDAAEEAGVIACGRGPEPAGVAPDVLARFAQLARERPDADAVVAGGVTLSFADLDRRASQVAALVAARGAGPGSVVGIRLPRSADLLAAILGVLRAGAAYLPLSPEEPAERLRWIIDDSGATLVLTDHATPPDAGLGRAAAVRLDDPAADRDAGGAENAGGAESADLAAEPHAGRAGNADPAGVPDLPAYVIYTSGSTGRPKGVQVGRRSLAALLAGLEQSGLIREGAGRVGWNASPSFDASVQQWIRVCRGDTVVMLDEESRRSPERLAREVADAGLTDLDITPSHAAHLVTNPLPRPPAGTPLRLWVGGEAIPPALWTALAELSDVDAVNMYGTTETTVDTTWAAVRADTGPHLGTVLPGQVLRILDAGLHPVPVGTPGEVYIGGASLAHGYVNRPGLTAAHFVSDPWSSDGGRMYRTGDRARWTADGRVEFLGRLDRQVKVRGYRVELGEAEAVLASHPEVLECAVSRREQDGEAILAAYVRATPALTLPSLRDHADRYLPAWMRPATYTVVDEFPLNRSGKLDRAALDRLAPAAVVEAAPATPTTATEELLIRIWQDVLGVTGIGPDDHFFQAGGHSLLAIRVVARLKRQAHLTIPMTAVFENPVLRDLAAFIEQTIRDRLAAS